MSEICKAPWEGLIVDVRSNLTHLHHRLNVLRAIYAQPMTISSGYRARTEHEEIYLKKNSERARMGLAPLSVPANSWHLWGAAADIYDPLQRLQHFIEEREDLLEFIGFWCEDFSFTKTWVHVQIYPPKSERLFFAP